MLTLWAVALGSLVVAVVSWLLYGRGIRACVAEGHRHLIINGHGSPEAESCDLFRRGDLLMKWVLVPSATACSIALVGIDERVLFVPPLVGIFILVRDAWRGVSAPQK